MVSLGKLQNLIYRSSAPNDLLFFHGEQRFGSHLKVKFGKITRNFHFRTDAIGVVIEVDAIRLFHFIFMFAYFGEFQELTKLRRINLLPIGGFLEIDGSHGVFNSFFVWMGFYPVYIQGILFAIKPNSGFFLSGSI